MSPRPVPSVPRASGPSRRRALQLLGAGGAAVGVGALSACSDEAPANGSGAAAARTEIVVVTPDQASNVVRDYGYTAGTDNQDVTNNLHAQLLRKPYVEDGNALNQDLYTFDPYLAESYETSPDGLTFTFHLKQGVVSQQGNPLTADDVLWSFERKFATPGGGMAGYYKPMLTDPATQIRKVDDHTVTFTVVKAGYGLTLLANLAENIGSIYDSTYLKANATPADPYAVQWGVADMMRGNFGFGAYKLQSVTAGQEIVMVSNPDFVLGAPHVTKMTRRLVEDAATRANMVKQGDADVALGLRPSDQKALEADDSVLVPDTKTNSYLLMAMNTTRAPFDDPAVRYAMSFAVPYGQIISDVYSDRAYQYNHILDDTAPGYDDSKLPEFTFDPGHAKELLAAAGVNDLSFTLSVNNQLPSVQDTAIQIQSALADAGITVKIAELPAAQLNQDSLDGKLEASLAVGAAVTNTPPYMLSLLTQPGGGSNTALWNDPPFLAEVAAGLDAGDALGAPAMTHWQTAELRMVTQAPYVMIARVKPAAVLRADIHGFAQRTDFRIDYSNLEIA
ncbi:ABC transporter substrate-binding protein [Kineococcus rhizosphaerae]|uniref:Peptide/nickel transport system substrate-binding protein n=1 Tax=Kineococcus rhizosphaerae TaxID=559628 RepID=A0A2T0QYB3_9ACTN|nr:ABC transporter substrate-binding protein [Kineococcus rhizosphaerae]PRY11195.1 peptide/nickel transport system substrate-binding protein [Kineococcus rhizosphaerae]